MTRTLFDIPPLPAPEAMRFHGESYSPELDQKRLVGQLKRVYEQMSKGAWMTLRELSEATGGDPEASVSARLRDIRRLDGHDVLRRRRGEPSAGLWEYRMVREA